MKTEQISFRWMRRIALLFIVLILSLDTTSAEPVRDGLVWLVSQQDPCGNWGDPTTTAYRDTCVALDALNKLGIRDVNCGGAWPLGISWLTDVNNPAPNWEYLAREMILRLAANPNDPNIDQQREELITGRLGSSFYCWGAAEGYNGDVMDTVQILKALDASWSGGYLECDDVDGSEWEDTYFLYIPPNATALVLYMTAYSGQVDVQFQFGEGGYYLAPDWNPSTTARFDSNSSPPIETDCMFEVGIRNSQASPSQYCLRAKYVTTDFNVVTNGQFLDETLGALVIQHPDFNTVVSINDDDGWGLVYQHPSSVFFTAHAVLALQEYMPYIALFDEIPYNNFENYPGFSWLFSFIAYGDFCTYLSSHQNPDGGFGDGGQSTVYETALSYQALKMNGIWDPCMVAARDYIEQAQDANDGSWNQSIYETALALQALGPLESMRVVTGDLNCDCCVDFVDFAGFALHWLENDCSPSDGWCAGTLLGSDDIVNFDDLAEFAENWLVCEDTEVPVPVRVYQNYDANGINGYYPPGTDLMADDIYLGGTERKLDHYDVTVYAPDGTAPYNVTSELYTDSAGYPSTAIAGTYCLHTINSDGLVVLDCAPDSGVLLDDNVWMVLSFSNPNAGWVFGEAAELGYTDDVFAIYEASAWTLYSWGGSPYAGFEANIWCTVTMAGQ
jgi:hypothetical protein